MEMEILPVRGKSTRQAIAAVLDQIDQAVAKQETKIRSQMRFLPSKWHPIAVSMLVAVVFIVVFAIAEGSSNGTEASLVARPVALLVEGLVVLLISILNLVLLRREESLRLAELSSRLLTVVEPFRDLANHDSVRSLPEIPAPAPSSTVRLCLRDGERCYVPDNLIVEGDLLLLWPGELAPCRVRFCGADTQSLQVPSSIMSIRSSTLQSPLAALIGFEVADGRIVPSLSAMQAFQASQTPSLISPQSSQQLQQQQTNASSHSQAPSQPLASPVLKHTPSSISSLSGATTTTQTTAAAAAAATAAATATPSTNNGPSVATCDLVDPLLFEALEYPLTAMLDTVLKSTTNTRPPTVIEREMSITGELLMKYVVPGTFLIALLTNVIRYTILTRETGPWPAMFLSLPATVILPLVPLLFPTLWLAIHVYCSAVLLDTSRAVEQWSVEQHTGGTTKAHRTAQNDYTTAILIDSDPTGAVLPFQTSLERLRLFWDILRGRETRTLPRSAPLVRSLGNATRLCCVDKRGVLSEAEESVAKVWFAHEQEETHEMAPSSSSSSSASTTDDELDLEEDESQAEEETEDPPVVKDDDGPSLDGGLEMKVLGKEETEETTASPSVDEEEVEETRAFPSVDEEETAETTASPSVDEKPVFEPERESTVETVQSVPESVQSESVESAEPVTHDSRVTGESTAVDDEPVVQAPETANLPAVEEEPETVQATDSSPSIKSGMPSSLSKGSKRRSNTTRREARVTISEEVDNSKNNINTVSDTARESEMPTTTTATEGASMTKAGAGESHAATDGHARRRFVVLDLSKGLRFEESHWQQYIEQMKPLALNSLLMAGHDMPAVLSSVQRHANYQTFRERGLTPMGDHHKVDRCMCALGNAVGLNVADVRGVDEEGEVSEEAASPLTALQMVGNALEINGAVYERLKTIYCFAPRHCYMHTMMRRRGDVQSTMMAASGVVPFLTGGGGGFPGGGAAGGDNASCSSASMGSANLVGNSTGGGAGGSGAEGMRHPHRRRAMEGSLVVPSVTSMVVSIADADRVRAQGATSADDGTKNLFLFTSGAPPLLFPMCTDFWDGRQLLPMDAVQLRAAQHFYQAHTRSKRVTAFSFRPLEQSVGGPSCSFIDIQGTEVDMLARLPFMTGTDSDDEDLPCSVAREDGEPNALFQLMQRQIFVGMIATHVLPKQDVIRTVEALDKAGIRFVYFSDEDEMHSKEFAMKMGIETGWNCHISLGEENETTMRVKPSKKLDFVPTYAANKSRLPKGVRSIRPHLESVDDVPLLVPLFTECSNASSAEMMKIMQEYAEVICCLGCAYNCHNVAAWCAADCAFALEPLRAERCPMDHFREKEEARLDDIASPLYDLSSAINTVPCSLTGSRSTPLQLFIVSLYSSRRLLACARRTVTFALGATIALSLSMLFAQFLLLPPLFNVTQLLFTLLIPIPLLSWPILLQHAHNDDETRAVERALTVKNKNHLPDRKRFVFLFAYRILPIALSTCLVFALVLNDLCHANKNASTSVCAALQGDRALATTHPYTFNGVTADAQLAFAQSFSSFAFLLYLIVLSMSFLRRNTPFWLHPPSRSPKWCLAALLTIVLQIVFFAIYMNTVTYAPSLNVALSDIQWYTYVVTILLLVPLIALNEHAKGLDGRRYIRFQKRAFNVFNTKLGMHSPV